MGKINTICHLGDIHIRKIPTRNEEYEKVFNNLFESIKKEKPDRIVVVGDLGHNYLDLGTEQLVLVKKFLNGLANIAPVKITRGNHDFRRKNSKRLDAVAAIVKLIDNSNIGYYDKTGFYYDENICWAVWHHGENNNNPWSTKEGKKILTNKEQNNHTYIDLFHDPISGCKSTTGFEMKRNSYYKLGDFKGNYSFLGDIHLQQYFSNKTKGYSGSLIAQDFSEGDDAFHGYLLWNIENGDVREVPIYNDWSFKNIKLTPFTDFNDLDFEIENPTKYMKVRIIWSTLPSTRNKENERKVVDYIKNYSLNENIISISHKNEFVEDDIIDVDENVNVDDITDQEVQHEIFKEYLDKIGLQEKEIEDIIKFDNEISSKIEINGINNIEWDVVKFGAKNFMSYEEIDIDWNGKDGLYQITGVNTAGKTTILKILSYVLFSKTLETETRVKYGDSRFVNNKNGSDFCEGYLVLDVDGEYYGIKRRTDIERKKDGEIKGAPTKVWYYTLTSPDDEMTDENCIEALTEDNKNKTQKKIDEIVGDYDNFNRIVMTTSDTLNRILSNDMAIFIDSLLFDSGLDVFDKKLEIVKEYQKELNQKSRITCDISATEEKNKIFIEEIDRINEVVQNINDNVIPDYNERIKRGEEYVDVLTKKLYKIDPEIANLDVQNTLDDVNSHQVEIDRYLARKGVIKESIKPLKETYNEERYNELIGRKEEHKKSVYDLNLEKRDFQSKIETEEHKIEIENGKIHILKQDGTKKKEEIKELKESKTCPTCGQLMTEEHRKHIDEKIKKIEKEMFEIARKIGEHQIVIEERHKPKIEEYYQLIKKDEDLIENLSTKMEDDLKEIGELTNDKNDVEKRKELQTELNQIPTKIENEELKRDALKKKIEDHKNSEIQIEENIKIQRGISTAKEKLGGLREELNGEMEKILNYKNEIVQYTQTINNNIKIIEEFKEQEYQDLIINTYKKCVHRDGIPRQLLSNHIIPKINVELDNMLSVAPFKVWLDSEDLRPKLAYYNTPDAVIDAISASGKERTFTSVVLKTALNQINVKSKPTIFLLDEIMGKLDNEGSVEEFVQILQTIKEKNKKFIIIEHVHEISPDYIISVDRDDNGISSAKIE